jgi:hypothetical protein
VLVELFEGAVGVAVPEGFGLFGAEVGAVFGFDGVAAA